MDDADDAPARPDWWEKNRRLKTELGLPAYEPPAFEDGRYTHEVVPDVEAAHDCQVRFVGVNPRYPDDWAVWLDGDPAFPIGRHRDENGNTVYELTADEFRARVADALESRRE